MEPSENNTTIIPLLESQNGNAQKTYQTNEPMPKFRKFHEIRIRDVKFKLVLLLLTLGGFVSDVYNGTSFIRGQYYTKNVKNPSDPSIHSGCILESSFSSGNDSLPQISETSIKPVISVKSSDQKYKYKCFEKDEIYGSLTLAVLFLPGFFSIYDINEHQSSLLEWSPSVYLLPVLYLLYIFCFPIVFLTFKIIHIFLHPGNVLEHIATRSDQAKALFEDSPQLALQLYILLCEADRRPRTIQLIAIFFTCLNIAIPSVKTYLLRKNILHINTETKEYWIYHVLKNYLVFFLIALFRIFSFSFLICLVRYNVIFIYVGFFLSIRIFLNIASVLEESTGKLGVFHKLQGEGTKSLFLNFFSIHDIRKGKHVMLFYMSIWLIFYLFSTVILMVLGSVSESESPHSLFFLPSVKIVTWSELFIIRHISLLFIIGILSILFGISSYFLFIWKIFLRYDDVEGEKGQRKKCEKVRMCMDGHTHNIDVIISEEKLAEGDVPEDILRLIWEPYSDRTHFQNIFKSETEAQNLKHMTLLVDPWQFAKFANKYLSKGNQIEITNFKSNDSILKKLVSTFNPDNHMVDDEHKDIGKEICFRAKIAMDFLNHLKHAGSDLGVAEKNVRREVTDALRTEYEEKTKKEVKEALQKQQEEWEQKQRFELENEKKNKEDRKRKERESSVLKEKKDREDLEAIAKEKEMKTAEEAAKKASVHETISMHIANGKSIDDIYFSSIIRGALLSVRDVLDRGIDMNIHYTKPSSPQWWTALHLAAANGRDDIVKLLVEAGMDVNLPTSAQNTPLRFAAMYGHLSTCKLLLLELGADMNIKGFDGKTGKEWIIEKNNELNWSQSNVIGCPDKFVENVSYQHKEIIELMLDLDSYIVTNTE